MKLIRLLLLTILGISAYGFFRRPPGEDDLNNRRLHNAANHALEAAYEVTQWSAEELKGLKSQLDENSSIKVEPNWNH